jgi:hypothetical protein
MTTAPQTIKEFFAQYSKEGHIFPDGGLRVFCRNGVEQRIMLIPPAYHQYGQRLMNDYGASCYYMDGTRVPVTKYIPKKPRKSEWDITIILGSNGEIIAGEQ